MHVNVGIEVLTTWIRRAQWSLSLSYVMPVQKAVTYNIYFFLHSHHFHYRVKLTISTQTPK
jgi:hypothetical protein